MDVLISVQCLLYYIIQNTDAGESVLQVMAVDSDSGANAAVTYELERSEL